MTTPPVTELIAALPSHYAVGGPIGSGGQGAVYLGTAKGRKAAVKFFRVDADARRVDREIAALEAVDSPHVVKLVCHDRICVASGAYFVVAYEFHGGGDLKNKLTNPGDLTFDEVFEIAQNCSAAIDAIWAKRIVHRDIKPGNIVCADDGRYVLVDFGLAKLLDFSDITHVGTNPGTYGYMSPEQYRGQRALTFRSDAFSLGLTIYLLATHKHPFNGAQPMSSSPSPVPLASRRKDFPKPFCDLVDQMLSIVAARRPIQLTSKLLKSR